MAANFSTIQWVMRQCEDRPMKRRKGRIIYSPQFGLVKEVQSSTVRFKRAALETEIGRELCGRLQLIAQRLEGKDEQTMTRVVVERVADFLALANNTKLGLGEDPLFVLRIILHASRLYDDTTYDHQLRVANLCARVGPEMDLAEEATIDLEIAALVHDFGKVGLDRAVLNETQPWDPGRRKEMGKIHLQIGVAVIGAVQGLEHIARTIRYNHYYEGYPDGMEKEEIPLEGQILSAVDFFDALTNPRPSRNWHARNPERALAEIEERSRSTEVRTPYDPRIIAVLRKIALSQQRPL